jgi:hypothetical protein
MNVVITIVLVVVFAVLGFFVGCFACLKEIEQLTYEKKTLNEWLEAARVCNNKLAKENTQLLTDIELISNGKSIIRNED